MNSDSKATYPSEGEGFPLPIPSLRKRNREFKSFPPPIAKKRGRSNFKPQKLCRPLLKPSNARFNSTKFSGGKEAKDMNFDENFPWEEQSESQERSEPPARQFPGSGPLRPISSTSRGEQNSEKATSLVVRKRKSFYGGLVPSRRRRVSSRHRSMTSSFDSLLSLQPRSLWPNKPPSPSLAHLTSNISNPIDDDCKLVYVMSKSMRRQHRLRANPLVPSNFSFGGLDTHTQDRGVYTWRSSVTSQPTSIPPDRTSSSGLSGNSGSRDRGGFSVPPSRTLTTTVRDRLSNAAWPRSESHAILNGTRNPTQHHSSSSSSLSNRTAGVNRYIALQVLEMERCPDDPVAPNQPSTHHTATPSLSQSSVPSLHISQPGLVREMEGIDSLSQGNGHRSGDGPLRCIGLSKWRGVKGRLRTPRSRLW